MELKCRLNSSRMLPWRTSSQVCQRGIICQHCSAQRKMTYYFQQWYSVRSYGTALDAQISLKIISLKNLTQLLRWKEFNFSAPYILSVCRGKCEILPVQSIPIPPALYQVCVCCSTVPDLALWLWWRGMSCFELLAEFHRGFLNKDTESDLLPSMPCCLSSGKN